MFEYSCYFHVKGAIVDWLSSQTFNLTLQCFHIFIYIFFSVLSRTEQFRISHLKYTEDSALLFFHSCFGWVTLETVMNLPSQRIKHLFPVYFVSYLNRG